MRLCLASIPLGTYVNYVHDIESGHVRHVLLNACSTCKHVVYRTYAYASPTSVILCHALTYSMVPYGTIIRTPLLMSRTGSRATTTILPYYSCYQHVCTINSDMVVYMLYIQYNYKIRTIESLPARLAIQQEWSPASSMYYRVYESRSYSVHT